MAMSRGLSAGKDMVMGSVSGAQVGPEHSVRVGSEKRGTEAALPNKSKGRSLFSLAGYVAFRKIPPLFF